RINALGSTPSTSPLGSRVGTDLKSGNDQYNSLTDTTVTEFGDTVTAESNAARTAALRDTAIVLGAVLLALAIALVISRSLIDPDPSAAICRIASSTTRTPRRDRTNSRRCQYRRRRLRPCTDPHPRGNRR
ncbi:hypothetical protein, partial [Xanthomonas arboricola]|uniref:hypothetical protein n=1 Tax=Xanthomonas arboricola TaxID=56448 RepID=UPI0019D204C3